MVQQIPGPVARRPAGPLALEHRLMTLGEYPIKVQPRIPDPARPIPLAARARPIRNVAPLVGLTSRGPNQAGGSIFDDFTGDGLPDVFTTSLG